MNKGFLSPGVKFLNNFNYPTKIKIISAIFILFTIFLFLLVIKNINQEIKYAQRGKIGVEYILAFKHLLRDIQTHRDLTNLYLHGKTDLKYEILKNNKEIESYDIAFINNLQKEYKYTIKIDKIWKEINNDWDSLKDSYLTLSPEENFKEHTVLILKTMYLIFYIGDVSNLFLTPQKDIYYLSNAVTVHLPILSERVGTVKNIEIDLSIKNKLTEQEKINLIILSTIIKQRLSSINEESLQVFKFNAKIRNKMIKVLEDLNISVNDFLKHIDLIISGSITKIHAEDFFKAGINATNSIYRFYQAELNSLDYLLSQKIKKLEEERAILSAILFLILSGLIYLFACFSYALIRSLKTLEESAQDVSVGNLDTEAKIYSTFDEIGIFSISFNKMIKNLKALVERESILRKTIISSLQSQNINETMQNIVNSTGKAFNADCCFMLSYDTQNKEFLPVNPNSVYISSPEIKSFAGRKFSTDELSVSTNIAVKQKQVVAVNDVEKINVPEKERILLNEYGIKSFMVSPMFYSGKHKGLLIIYYVKNYKEFTEDEKSLLETIANQFIIVINQAFLTDRLHETIKREALLRKIINNILSSTNLKKALDLISEEIGRIFDAERVKIRNYNLAEGVFSEVISEYRKNDSIPSAFEKGKYAKEVSDAVLNLLTKERKPFVADNVEESELPEPLKVFCKEMSIKSVVEAPIFYKDQILASIIIENITTTEQWDQEKVNLLATVCQQIALGINLFNLNDELQKALINEKTLRQITDDINMFKNYSEINDYMLTQLLNIFNVERAICFHFIKDSIIITNEKTSTENIISLKESWRFTKANLENIIIEPRLFITINNTESEIKNGKLKDYLRSQNINSFIIYPTVKKIFEENESEEVLELTMLANSINHNWTEYEKNLLQLIIDTISIISLKIIQKEEIEEIKRTFMATLTHDLRSPIIAEQKAIEAMISKKISPSDEYFEEYLEDIYKTNNGLLKIVNNLLSIYHYESGKLVLNKEETNVREMIEETIISMKYLAADKESQIFVDIARDLPLVFIDKSEIGRVLTNLVGNAIKHTRNGTRIEIKAEQKDNDILFSVRDNGEGIPKEHVDMIFQRYPTEKRKVGTGLGLYLSKQIIEAHNGKIWFETEENVGTTFYFTLPL